jgi:hypothetical protein
VQHNNEDPRLFQTCMFSSYMDDYVPAIMREVSSLYDIDCFYTNGWPPLGNLPDCYCAICSKLPSSDTPAYWRVFTNRVLLELWRKYDAIANEKKPDCFFFANSGGNVRGGPNLNDLGKVSAWFQADNQGRSYGDPVIWGCSLQGRVCNAVLDGKFAANVTAAYSTCNPVWRNVSKNPAETRMWLSETLAGGMVPYLHFVGAENGFTEDRRWQQVGAEYFRWTAQHDAHLTTRRSIANVGVVIGQSTQLLYPGPGSSRSRAYMHETTQGIYLALLQGRFAFDFVHEDRLDPEHISRYRALLLPNVAMLSDRQCQQLREYVRSGGSLMASFETSLYDENLKPRADFGLAELMGASKAADAVGTNGSAYFSTHRICRQVPPACAAGWLQQHRMARWRAESRSAQAHRQTAANRRSGLRTLPSGTRLSYAAAYHRARCRSPRIRIKPNRVVLGRHRAHLLAYRPRRPPAAAS